MLAIIETNHLYEGFTPKFLLHMKSLVLQVHQTTLLSFMVLGTRYVHIAFQGSQWLHFHENVKHMQPPLGKTYAL